MDAIVVDTQKCGFECIAYMREQRIGRTSFIPLDTIKVKPLNERLRSLGHKHRLCADIIEGGDDSIRRAIMYAVGNTVVCDTLDDARALCYGQGERIKAVTLGGAMISKAGNITGGNTAGDLDRAGRWDEKAFAELKARRQVLEAERENLSREHRNRSLQTELKTKVQGLKNKVQYSSADLELTQSRLREIAKHTEGASSQLQEVRKSLGNEEEGINSMETELSSLQERVDSIENEVFAPFLASVGASDIRAFEEGQLKDMQGHNQRRMKLREHRAKLEAQLEYERSRNFEGPLEKLTGKVASRRKELQDLTKQQKGLVAQEKALMEAGDQAERIHSEAKDASRAKETEVKFAQSNRSRLTKERSGVGKRILAEETTLEQLRAKLHDVLQRARVEEVTLPVVGGDGDGGNSAGEGGRKRGRGGAEADENDEDGEGEQSQGGSVANSAASEVNRGWVGFVLLDNSSSQVSSTLNFSQGDSRAMQEDRAAALKVDLSSLKRHRSVEGPHALEEILNGYKRQMATLQREIDQMQPNMKANQAVERYGDVSDRLKASGQSFEQAKQNAMEATNSFNEAKQKRYDAFMSAFGHVSENLNTIYKDLTRSSKHPLGGNAYLSVDDQEEPYLGGIKFNAMPPMKRFRDMEQLSGGEKTVAALALLFAIHSFRPAPFFVMDEIDAALDNINVKKVCNYIQQRSDEFQSIIISLKDMFYEKADALVGICRDKATNSSRTLTLDLEAIANS
ncbi:unnamed protein product [Choristocarpus tenellus]